MKSENQEWKPEIGQTAWFIELSDNGYVIVEGTVRNTKTGYPGYAHIDSNYFGHSHCHPSAIFPTAEAALASIKVYDLEGNEVVVTRAEPSVLEWHHYEDGSALASDGDWAFYADDDGDWNVKFQSNIVGIGNTPYRGLETAIDSIYQWRVNHLNSMIKK